MRKIIEAEILSEHKTRLKITLSTGEVIHGYSMGIIPLFDDDGEEIDDVLAFDSIKPEAFYILKDSDIIQIELSTTL